MTEKMEELLNDWGFIDDLEEFINWNLDEETMLYLNDTQLEKLFDGNVGKLIKFKIAVAKYIQENVRNYPYKF